MDIPFSRQAVACIGECGVYFLNALWDRLWHHSVAPMNVRAQHGHCFLSCLNTFKEVTVKDKSRSLPINALLFRLGGRRSVTDQDSLLGVVRWSRTQ